MQLVREHWNKEDAKEFYEFLMSKSEAGFHEFNSALVPGTESIGIRVPILREIAKEIAKGNFREYLALPCGNLQEERMLYGFVIGYAKISYEEFLLHFKNFLPLIDSWAVCDSCSATFKIIKKHKQEHLEFIKEMLQSNEEFTLRYCTVALMDYYIDAEHIDFVLEAMKNIHHDAYYVKMAVAWAVSVCFVKFREQTLPLIESKVLDDFTQNKAIQKIRESYRADKADKDMLLAYKK